MAGPSTDTLDRLIGVVAGHFARSDQKAWATRLTALRGELTDRPRETARTVLAMFEGPGAHGRTVTEGDWALDSIVLTTDGVAFERPGVAWEEVLAFPRDRSRMRRAALALWQALGVDDPPLPDGRAAPVKLADYGWGCEVWAREGRFFARYDRGGHQASWREDEISESDARAAVLDGAHFTFLVLLIEERLRAAGRDPWEGSPTPLPDP